MNQQQHRDTPQIKLSIPLDGQRPAEPVCRFVQIPTRHKSRPSTFQHATLPRTPSAGQTIYDEFRNGVAGLPYGKLAFYDLNRARLGHRQEQLALTKT